MKQATIKIVTVNRDFSEADKATFRRIVAVLQEHNLSVALTISKDRHKKQLKNIELRAINGAAV